MLLESFPVTGSIDPLPIAVAALVLGEKLKWNYAVSLLCLGLAVYFAFGVNRTPATGA